MSCPVASKHSQQAPPLQWLHGVWRGKGQGCYPTVKPFEYNEEITIVGNPSGGRPVLHYKQRSWSKGPHPRPMHEETGWIRVLLHAEHPSDKTRVEVVLSAQNGVTTVEEGTVSGMTMVLESTSMARSSTARKPYATQFGRVFEVDMTQDPPVLHYTMDMETENTPLTRHLEAWLVRQPPTAPVNTWSPYSNVGSPAAVYSPAMARSMGAFLADNIWQNGSNFHGATANTSNMAVVMGGTSPVGPGMHPAAYPVAAASVRRQLACPSMPHASHSSTHSHTSSADGVCNISVTNGQALYKSKSHNGHVNGHTNGINGHTHGLSDQTNSSKGHAEACHGQGKGGFDSPAGNGACSGAFYCNIADVRQSMSPVGCPVHGTSTPEPVTPPRPPPSLPIAVPTARSLGRQGSTPNQR